VVDLQSREVISALKQQDEFQGIAVACAVVFMVFLGMKLVIIGRASNSY
jgi:hypothetical protein